MSSARLATLVDASRAVAATSSRNAKIAHLADGHWRRLSFHRDRLTQPPPPEPITSERDLAALINRWNGEFVQVSRRYSGRVLTANYADASRQLADFFEPLPLETPARDKRTGMPAAR